MLFIWLRHCRVALISLFNGTTQEMTIIFILEKSTGILQVYDPMNDLQLSQELFQDIKFLADSLNSR